MKPHNILITLIALLISVPLFAHDGGFGGGSDRFIRQEVLRKVIATSEIVALNNPLMVRSAGAALVDRALERLRDARDGRGDLEFLGTYRHPGYLHRDDGDADFRIPSFRRFREFTFDISGDLMIEYVMLFATDGHVLLQRPVNQSFRGGQFNFMVPPHIRPDDLGTIRLHVRADRDSAITAYGNGRGGGGNPGDLSIVVRILEDVRSELSRGFPNSFEIRRLLADAERILERP